MEGFKPEKETAIKAKLKSVAQEYFEYAKEQFPEENFTNPYDALTRILLSPENNAYRKGYIEGAQSVLVATYGEKGKEIIKEILSAPFEKGTSD